MATLRGDGDDAIGDDDSDAIDADSGDVQLLRLHSFERWHHPFLGISEFLFFYLCCLSWEFIPSWRYFEE